jgi:hypothetical protein
MKKIIQLIAVFLVIISKASAQTDFVPGYNVIFEDKFERDPVGDFPAKWNTSGSGQVVLIDNEKWLKINQPTAVSPVLKKALPENCTIEFDIYMKPTGGVAPHIMFGLTKLSNVASGDVYRNFISLKLEGYNEKGHLVMGKNIQDLMSKDFPLEGSIERALHVSIAVNGPRLRIYLDEDKVVDLPKLLTPEYRKNFFIASSEVIPAAEEGVYISNIRIASGDADARSLLIRQLMEQGSVVTNDIQFSPETNQVTPASQPLLDQLGQTMQQNPDMSIQVNSVEEVPATQATETAGYMPSETPVAVENGSTIVNKTALKAKADKIKAYLVSKFKIRTNRIVTDAKAKITTAVAKNKTAGKAKQLLTEFVKL